MMNDRRQFIKNTAVFAVAIVSGLIRIPSALALWKAEDFAPGLLEGTITRLMQNRRITDSDQITITIPKIAENGAVVPVSVTTSLANVKSISLLVEKNPVPLAVRFELAPELAASVSARLKMAETADVVALVETNDGFYRAKERVKVTIGGCGG